MLSNMIVAHAWQRRTAPVSPGLGVGVYFTPQISHVRLSGDVGGVLIVGVCISRLVATSLYRFLHVKERVDAAGVRVCVQSFSGVSCTHTHTHTPPNRGWSK